MKHLFEKSAFQIVARLRRLSERTTLILDRQPCLIYTMGKVGSTSLYLSLKKQLGGKIIPTHRIHPISIRAYEEHYLKLGKEPYRSDMGTFIYKHCIQKQNQFKVISLVREPIGRNISDFFQDLPAFHAMSFDEKTSIESLKNSFLQNYPHHFAIQWFENEFRPITKLDILASGFDQQKKYQYYQNKQVKALIMRLDLPDSIKEQQIAHFLGLSEFKIKRKNVGNEKKYATTYQQFKQQVQLPQTYIVEMLDSLYTKTFYTKDEINQLKQKWKSSP